MEQEPEFIIRPLAIEIAIMSINIHKSYPVHPFRGWADDDGDEDITQGLKTLNRNV